MKTNKTCKTIEERARMVARSVLKYRGPTKHFADGFGAAVRGPSKIEVAFMWEGRKIARLVNYSQSLTLGKVYEIFCVSCSQACTPENPNPVCTHEPDWFDEIIKNAKSPG